MTDKDKDTDKNKIKKISLRIKDKLEIHYHSHSKYNIDYIFIHFNDINNKSINIELFLKVYEYYLYILFKINNDLFKSLIGQFCVFLIDRIKLFYKNISYMLLIKKHFLQDNPEKINLFYTIICNFILEKRISRGFMMFSNYNNLLLIIETLFDSGIFKDCDIKSILHEINIHLNNMKIKNVVNLFYPDEPRKHIIEIENIATEFYFNINILRYTWIGVVIRSINLKYYKN